MGGNEEALAASYLLDKHDLTRLTWREIKDGWGSCENFMYSFGLKPWNREDLDEALAISRGFKEQDKVNQQQ